MELAGIGLLISLYTGASLNVRPIGFYDKTDLPRLIALELKNISNERIKVYRPGETYLFFSKVLVEKDGTVDSLSFAGDFSWIESPEEIELFPGKSVKDTIEIPINSFINYKCKSPKNCTPFVYGSRWRFSLKFPAGRRISEVLKGVLISQDTKIPDYMYSAEIQSEWFAFSKKVDKSPVSKGPGGRPLRIMHNFNCCDN